MQETPDGPALPRRSVLAGTVLLGAAVATAEIGLAPAKAAADARYVEGNWRFCVNCFNLVSTDYTATSICPRTSGPHQPMGWTFMLVYNLAPDGIGEDATDQGHWRHCFRCASLYWAYSSSRHCPAGGTHAYDNTTSYYAPQYLLLHDVGMPAGTQNLWRFCSKCSALFYNGYAYKDQYGLCPYDNNGHSAAGYDFAIQVSNYDS